MNLSTVIPFKSFNYYFHFYCYICANIMLNYIKFHAAIRVGYYFLLIQSIATMQIFESFFSLDCDNERVK